MALPWQLRSSRPSRRHKRHMPTFSHARVSALSCLDLPGSIQAGVVVMFDYQNRRGGNMSRVFLSLHPYFEGGPIMGRTQANIGFINALFRRDPFDLYHFFVDNPKQLMKIWGEAPDAAPLLDRGALQAFPRTMLERRLQMIPYTICHLSDPMSEFSALCRARNALAPRIFPVTAVNHTISYTEYAASTLAHVWDGCTVRDGIGCTSFSSRSIMQAWYQHARNTYALPQTWKQPLLKIIPLGVPDPELGGHEEMRLELRQRLGVQPETVILLLYGRISQTDKMDLRPLFTALRRVRVKHPELNFLMLLAGATQDEGGLKEQLTALSKMWDIPFDMRENPSRTLKKQLFAAADVFVSPTDNIQETFGLTLVEAAQAGLPTISSDWNGYKDIIVQGQTGFLIPTVAPTDTPMLDTLSRTYFNQLHQFLRCQQTAIYIPLFEEALIKLISDAPLRKRMGQAAKERAAQLYRFDRVVDQWVTFWEELNNIPISPEEVARLRHTKHPLSFDYGNAFACYASHHLQEDTVLRCTELGRACVEKKAPWNNYALVSVNLQESFVHTIIHLTHEECTVSEILKNARQNRWGKNLSDETLLGYILWLIKQDLIEYSLPAHTVTS